MNLAIEPRCAQDGEAAPDRLTEAEIAAIAKALSHPERIRILGEFRPHRPRNAGDIVMGSSRAQSTVSEHLRILREAGILLTHRDGPRTWYCLHDSVLEAFCRAVASFGRPSPGGDEAPTRVSWRFQRPAIWNGSR